MTISAVSLLAVAIGGAMGAMGRFLVMSGVGHLLGHSLPYGTLVVNLMGSFVLGSLVHVFAVVWSPAPEVRAMVVIGVLGAFTTFSTFSMDAYDLLERGQWLAATGYIAGSVVTCVAAFWAGLQMARMVAP